MKFTTSSADLKMALDIVGGAVPSKSTLPILECVLFERDGDRLKLSATDLEISIIERVPVTFQDTEDEKSDRIAVPARRLLDTLRALPDLPIEFTTTEELHVELKTDQGHYKMIGHDGADYPGIPSFEGSQTLDVPAELLQRAIQKTGFAVSKDALRPAMMGILFQIKTNETQVVATDGHRLVRLALKSISSQDPLDFIVPSKALSLASRVAQAETCSVAVGSGFASFDYGDTTVLARLIDESYPNYEAVIPKDNDRALGINRQSMLQAVKRVALYSSTMTHQIRLSLKENRIEFSAEDIERASEAREHVLCEYSDEPMEIGFNSVYLTEVLSNLDADDVTFRFSSPNRAGVVEPSEQAEDEEVLMLIMPVMLTPAYG
jgi:DNA polymerase-3 subunit beta